MNGGSGLAVVSSQVAVCGVPRLDGEGNRSDCRGLRPTRREGNPGFACIVADVHHRDSERVRDAFNRALTFAERREDSYQQLRLLSGLSMCLYRTIDVTGGVALRAESVANKTGNRKIQLSRLRCWEQLTNSFVGSVVRIEL